MRKLTSLALVFFLASAVLRPEIVVVRRALSGSSPIAIDGTPACDSTDTGTTLTLSQTLSGPNSSTWVVPFANLNRTFDSVTFNGVAATITPHGLDDSGNGFTQAAYHIEGATGTHDWVVTGGGSAYFGICVISFKNAKQSGQPDAENPTHPNGTGGDDPATVTTVAAGAYPFAVIQSYMGGAGTATHAVASTAVPSCCQYYLVDLSGPKVTPGAYTMNGTDSGGFGMQKYPISVAPAP